MHSGLTSPEYLQTKRVNGRNGSVPEADGENAVNSESLQIREGTEKGGLEGERNLVVCLGPCRAGVTVGEGSSAHLSASPSLWQGTA